MNMRFSSHSGNVPTRLGAGVLLNDLIRSHLRIVREVVSRVLLRGVECIGLSWNRIVIVCNVVVLLLLIHCERGVFVVCSSGRAGVWLGRD